MEKQRKKIRIIFWVIVIVGSMALGIGTAAFEPDTFAKTALVLGWMAAVAVCSITIDLLWYRALNRKLRALQPILLQEHDADRYIDEINMLLAEHKSPHTNAVLKLNLCAAYCEKKEYHLAKEMLLQINPRMLSGINRAVYWADLAYVYFYLQENEQAILILEQQAADFSKLSDNARLGGLIAILSIFQKLAQGDRPGARQLFNQARPKWENDHTAPDFEYLESFC